MGTGISLHGRDSAWEPTSTLVGNGDPIQNQAQPDAGTDDLKWGPLPGVGTSVLFYRK